MKYKYYICPKSVSAIIAAALMAAVCTALGVKNKFSEEKNENI